MMKMSNELPLQPRTTKNSHIILHIRHRDWVTLAKRGNHPSKIPHILTPCSDEAELSPLQSIAGLEQNFDHFVVKQVTTHLTFPINVSYSTSQTQTDNSLFYQPNLPLTINNFNSNICTLDVIITNNFDNNI